MEAELQHTVLDGTADYIAALDTLCGLAQHSLYIFEKDFDGFGFNASARYATLRSFLLARPTNCLHLLAHDTRKIEHNCSRLMILLRQFSHGMHIHATPQHLQHLSEPFAVADDLHYVRRFHFNDPRGILAQHDAQGARALKARFKEMWAASCPAISPTKLGL